MIKNALSSHCTKTLDCRKLLRDKKFYNQEEMEKYLIKSLKQDNTIPDIVRYSREFDDGLLKKLSRLDSARHAAFEGWYESWHFSDNNP